MDDEAENQRWSAAAELALGVDDDKLPRRRNRTLVWVSALVAGCTIAGALLALLLPAVSQASVSTEGVSELTVVGQFVFLVLALLVGVGGFVWARRHGYYVTRWRHPASPLTRAEKKIVRRQIAGRQRVDQHLPIVVAIAKQDRKATLGVAPIYAALVLCAVSTAIASQVAVIRYLEIAAVLLFVVVAIQLAVAYRRTGRFIDAYEK